MATVTALREDRRGRVAVELDGAPWRTFPAEAVARAGLSVGATLDRERVRALRRELRRSEALSAAARVLRQRDLPTHALEERLDRRGIAPVARRDAVAALQRAGLVDDERFALARAATLAERGRGDAAIRWDLERQGVDAELVDLALAALEPEARRADCVVRRRGRGPATARLLAARGFGEEAVEGALTDAGIER